MPGIWSSFVKLPGAAATDNVEIDHRGDFKLDRGVSRVGSAALSDGHALRLRIGQVRQRNPVLELKSEEVLNTYHNKELQQKMFSVLGFTPEQAEYQFGFLMNAFRFGAPPHGGIALGFDRLCSLLAGLDNIRDVIAFAKNNAGRDVMIDSPSSISQEQLDELGININRKINFISSIIKLKIC